jgi:hypothetical protein
VQAHTICDEALFGLLRTFGDGCPEVFVIQAFMQFSHFWGYRSNNFFNSMRWAEDTSPKVRKSRMALS